MWQSIDNYNWSKNRLERDSRNEGSGQGASLAMVGHPSSDGVTIKIPYGINVSLHQPASYPIFSYWIS